MLLEEIQSFTQFDLLAQKAKEGFIAGMHKSPFRGFSVEFAEHRPYNPGESVKNIDWKLLARTDKKYIKQFDEETNLKAHLWVDVSPSMYYPKEQPLKLKLGVLGAGVIAHLLQQQKDSFSLGMYNDAGFVYRSPIKSTRGHLQQQIGQLGHYWEAKDHSKSSSPTATHSAVDAAKQSFESAALQVGRRHLVVVLSDLLWDPAEAAAEACFGKAWPCFDFKNVKSSCSKFITPNTNCYSTWAIDPFNSSTLKPIPASNCNPMKSKTPIWLQSGNDKKPSNNSVYIWALIIFWRMFLNP